MAKKKVVAVTMSEEQWALLTKTANNVESMQNEVLELQDAIIELAEIIAGGDE